MRLIYIDDSGDLNAAVFSAICIKDSRWRECFSLIKTYRRDINQRYGVLIHKELHATELVGGRGKISNRVVTKHQRSIIFRESIELLSRLPDVKILNACSQRGLRVRLFERLMNRINSTLQNWGERGILFIDQGNEVEYTRLLRKMTVFNPIPSNLGTWADTGAITKNIPVEWVIEDPIFKDSASSFFIQCADMAAFSLLRNEYPLPSRNKYGIDQCFAVLDPILVKQAFAKDPRKLGIIRA